jgi:transitional endoplasmic reticulum ATPase
MRKLIDGIESAAPCIVFIDEIDSILSSGRTSQGDSGTSGRMFNSFMDWMSNPSRAGRIVVVAASNRPDLLDGALIRAGRFDAKLPILPPTREDSNGRKEILKGLTRKLQVKFHKESLGGTEDIKNSGLGKLLKDTERIWTGAEIEVVIKEALDNAVFAERKKKDGTDDYTIMLDDWNTAMDSILPNTHEVESMCKLALYYTDNVGTYCPPEWRAIARNKDALRLELGLE